MMVSPCVLGLRKHCRFLGSAVRCALLAYEVPQHERCSRGKTAATAPKPGSSFFCITQYGLCGCQASSFPPDGRSIHACANAVGGHRGAVRVVKGAARSGCAIVIQVLETEKRDGSRGCAELPTGAMSGLCRRVSTSNMLSGARHLIPHTRIPSVTRKEPLAGRNSR